MTHKRSGSFVERRFLTLKCRNFQSDCHDGDPEPTVLVHSLRRAIYPQALGFAESNIAVKAKYYGCYDGIRRPILPAESR